MKLRYANLTEEMKQGIVESRRKPTQIRDIAKKFNTSWTIVNRVLKERMTKEEMIEIWNKNRKGNTKRRNKVPYYDLSNFHVLKRRLVEKELLEPVCDLCGWDYTKQKLWMELPKEVRDFSMPIELDHIDGDRTNNHIHNLRFLCPNCHSMQIILSVNIQTRSLQAPVR
jgi:hypothetical protein